MIARLSLTAAQVEEVQQLLRERLFMAAPGGSPKIASYSGRSALQAWLRVVALRTALNLQRGKSRWTGEAGLEALAAGADVELDHLRARYQEEFSRALRDAFSELTSKQRNLLRLRFMEGLTDEKIGRLFGVHQTTATRWIAAARDAVFAETRRLLSERLRLSTGEFESLILAVRSQLDVSLTGLFRTGKG
jgi:RNA polymerase sigma-70 factor (ECF subfamily)